MAKRNSLVVLLTGVLVALLLALPSSAFGEGNDGSSSTSSSSPSDAKEQSGDILPDPFADGLFSMGNDSLWAGRSLELSGHGFKNDLLAAGQAISITDCTAKGSIRAAAQSVTIADSSIDESITIAGQDVLVRNTKGGSIAMTGSTASFSGSCKGLWASAGEVRIDGVVDGDAYVNASQVEIGTNARIKGTLHVNAASEPVMQRGAEVGDVDFTKSEDTSAEATDAFAALGAMLLVIGTVVTIFGTIVVAVLSEWLFKRHTFAASRIIRSRTGATIGTGVIGSLVMPLCIVIMLVFVITAPVAIALICALVAMGLLAGGFMGASLFKLVFPQLGRYKCALAGGAIVGVASAIPLLGSLVRAVAVVYMVGYVLQSIYLGMREPAPTDKLEGTVG